MAVADFSLDLIEAKLAPPSIRPGTVAKTDVIAPLCASPLPFATVVAPAGYGKTTLLARWAEADPRPFAWVALDGRDNDAVLFMRYIAAAIHRVEPIDARGLRRAVRPGRLELVDARPAPRERADGARAPLGARARRPARRWRTRPASTCSPRCSSTFRRGRDRRSRAGRSRACPSPAGGCRGGCTRSA